MEKLEYIINPILMGGLVREIKENMVKIHLHGRLGVITVPKRLIFSEKELAPGDETQFYFSYLQVNETPYDYDGNAIGKKELIPSLIGAEITEVNDTAIKVELQEQLGTVAVPRRWVFTPSVLKTGQNVEFYFSSIMQAEAHH